MFDVHPSLSVPFTYFPRRSSFLLLPVADSSYTATAWEETAGGDLFFFFSLFTLFTVALFSLGCLASWDVERPIE